MQLLIFMKSVNRQTFGHILNPYCPFRVVGSNGLFAIWLLRNQVALPFSHTYPLRDFGGLKWTRTIDLTLIRRVL